RARIALVARPVAVVVEAVADLGRGRGVGDARLRARDAVLRAGVADAHQAGRTGRARAGIALVGGAVTVVVEPVAGLGLGRGRVAAGPGAGDAELDAHAGAD